MKNSHSTVFIMAVASMFMIMSKQMELWVGPLSMILGLVTLLVSIVMAAFWDKPAEGQIENSS